jgi:CBS domain-containing protein
MKVMELMSSDPICATPDTSLREIARMMCEHDCGEIPIVADTSSRRVVGVVTDRDITCRTVAHGKNPLELSAKDCMTTPVVTVDPQVSVDECCRVMESKQIRRVPVVDHGSCIGIVSQADLARHAPMRQLTAEVVAEISRPMISH